MLPEPHGGRLVRNELSESERARVEAEVRELPSLQPFIDQVYDAEKLAIGAYSPLDGFADRETLEAVCRGGRLPNGLPWPIPIFLAPSGRANTEVLTRLRPGEPVALEDPRGRAFAILDVAETYPFRPKEVAEAVYGTTDAKHPNVADLYALGTIAVAGKVRLLRRLELPHAAFELTPEETRAEFGRRGWEHVVGYQTRNVPHKAHEYLQRCTLERDDVDGLLIHPVVGRLKKGDYRPEVILEAYDAFVRNYYPADRVMLSSFTISMRYGGPKAALFFAIVRKNYGCGYYIVGRDQAGVGTFYDPFACHRIFDEFDIGVVALRYAETYFCRVCGGMASPRSCVHPKEDRVDTSQTRIRNAITSGGSLPTEILRPEVAEVLTRGDVLLPE